MENETELKNYSQMKGLWFARTLNENKIRIKSGKPKMVQEDYDVAWEKVKNDFLKRDSKKTVKI